MCRQVLFDVPRRRGDTTWSSGRSTRLPFALWPQRDRCMMRSVAVGCCNLVIDLFLRRVRRCNAVARTRSLRPMPQRASPIWASTETRTHPSSPHGTPSEPSHRILLGGRPDHEGHEDRIDERPIDLDRAASGALYHKALALVETTRGWIVGKNLQLQSPNGSVLCPCDGCVEKPRTDALAAVGGEHGHSEMSTVSSLRMVMS